MSTHNTHCLYLLPAMNRNVYITFVKFTSRGDPFFSYSTSYICLHPLFGLHKYSLWKDSMRHFCFVYIVMSDAILPDCRLDVIFNKNYALLAESYIIIAILSKSATNVVGGHNKINGITFKATLVGY